MANWVLLISPRESSTNEWEAVVLPTEEAVREEIYNRDLTKDHWFLPADAIAEMLDKNWAEEDAVDDPECPCEYYRQPVMPMLCKLWG